MFEDDPREIYFDVRSGKNIHAGVFYTKVLYDLDTMTPIYFAKPKIKNKVDETSKILTVKNLKSFFVKQN